MKSLHAGSRRQAAGAEGITALARDSAPTTSGALHRGDDADELTPTTTAREHAREADGSSARDEPYVHAHSWTNGASLMARASTIVLWVAIACGPLALLASAFSPVTPAVEDGAAETQSSRSDEASALAVIFVGTWLSATATNPEPFVTLLPGATVESTHPTAYRDLTVAHVTPSDAVGVVTVTVGGLIDESAPDSSGESAATSDSDADLESSWIPRHFQVAVATDGGVSILAEPALVAPPAPAAPVPEGAVTFDRTSEVSAAVELFLSAYLTSSHDLDRFTAPDAAIAPVLGAPYVAVTVRGLAAQVAPVEPPTTGDRLEMRASVSAVTRTENTHTLTYWLTLTARDGRWEVSAISAGPASSPSASAE